MTSDKEDNSLARKNAPVQSDFTEIDMSFDVPGKPTKAAIKEKNSDKLTSKPSKSTTTRLTKRFSIFPDSSAAEPVVFIPGS
jgi:hypothetical protein